MRRTLLIYAITLLLGGGCRSHSEVGDAFYVSDSGVEVCPDSIIDASGDIHKAHVATPPLDKTRTMTALPHIVLPSDIINALVFDELCSIGDTLDVSADEVGTAAIVAPGRAVITPRQGRVDSLYTAIILNHAGCPGDLAALRDAAADEVSAILADRFDATEQLPTGVPAAYTDADLPPWMSGPDRRALLSAQRAVLLHSLLTQLDDTIPLAPSQLATSIAKRLWIPNLGQMSAYMYGRPYPIQLQATDTRAASLAVISGAMSQPMAETAVTRMPVYDLGMPRLYPTPAEATDTLADATTLALRCVAACRVHNAAAIDHALASLMTRGTLSTHVTDGLPMLTAVIEGIFGMRLTEPGLLIEPSVPAWLADNKNITGLRYRDAILDITVRGSGNIISTFAIDNAAVGDHIVPADLKGHHSVTVTLTGTTREQSALNIVRPQRMPPAAQVQWPSPQHARMTMSGSTNDNILYLNGELIEVTDLDSYTLYDAPVATWVAMVPTADNEIIGFSAPLHGYFPPQAVTTIPATAAAEPGAKVLSDRITVRRRRHTTVRYEPSAYERDVVESTRWHNAGLDFEFDVRRLGPGLYGIDVEYLNGLGIVNELRENTERVLSVDGRPCAILTFTQLQPYNWRADKDWRALTAYSDMVFVHLDGDRATISLTQPALPNDDDNLLLVKSIRLVRVN